MTPHERYCRNRALIAPFVYAQVKGILFDRELLARLRAQCVEGLWAAQARVDAAAGLATPATPGEVLAACAASHLCAKVPMRQALKGYTIRTPGPDSVYLKKDGTPRKKPQIVYVIEVVAPRVLSWTLCLENANSDCRPAIERLWELCKAAGDGELSTAARAECASLLKVGLNVKSTLTVTTCLNSLGLPPMFKRRTRKASLSDDESSQTKDAEALQKLFLRTGHPITTALLETIGWRDKLEKECGRKVGSDGRMHSSFAIVGPSTDRTASYSGLDGSGGNAQNVPEKPINFRHCYLADPGHDWYRLDLTGADLWTVAARVAAEGDSTLLDDLRAGIRIPSLVGMMVEGYQPGSDRQQIAADARAYKAAMTPKDKWKDAVWKAGSHLSNYKGGPTQIQKKVIKDTYKLNGTPVDPSLPRCKEIQRIYLARYWGVPRWWAKTATTIMRTGALTFATGRVHEFLSRRPSQGVLDDETLREALASEPQHITTHVILEGLYRLWYDCENWESRVVGVGDPRFQPLLPCIHDELDGQALTEDRAWVDAKVPQWFNIPLIIAGTAITMPFAYKRGTCWGDSK